MVNRAEEIAGDNKAFKHMFLTQQLGLSEQTRTN